MRMGGRGGESQASLFTTLLPSSHHSLLTWTHKRRATHHGRNHCGCSGCSGLQSLLDLLVCVGRDNWADHRSCWDLHRFNRGDCGHRRHGSWDSCYGSPQNFLLKPGKAGQTPQLRTLHQF